MQMIVLSFYWYLKNTYNYRPILSLLAALLKVETPERIRHFFEKSYLTGCYGDLSAHIHS